MPVVSIESPELPVKHKDIGKLGENLYFKDSFLKDNPSRWSFKTAFLSIKQGLKEKYF
jgi:hypothetical protein